MNRKTTVILACCIRVCLWVLPANNIHAQQPWQKLSFPTAEQVKGEFLQPPACHSNSVTWGWDGPVNRQSIAHDLDSLYARGFRVATIEAGYRMPVEYLSHGWFALIKTAVEEAKKRKMHLWIIDEGKYPSGFAGGKFSKEKPELRMQALVIFERINAKAGQVISKKGMNSVVSAVALNLADSSSTIVSIRGGEINWTAPAGNWQLILAQPQYKTAVTRAVNNPKGGKDTTNSLCDYLSPIAVKQFIEFTHEQYKKHVGDEFGKTILGFRGDEPDYGHIPWTPNMLQEFKKRKGYDIQPYLASFFLRRLNDEQKRAKADYWDVWSELFGATFFKIQSDWCAANNLEYMTHLNHDEAMIGLVKSDGDLYRNMRSVQIPGIDVIWHQLWPGLVADFPKFASSAAHQNGRPRSLSESFAAMDPAPDIHQARWIMNHQFVRGINLFECMFFSSTSEGRGGAKGYMADPLFPSLMGYANRASYLLAQGRPTAEIAVYFPTSSLWLGHNESEKSTLDIARRLLETQHDFDFIDEHALTTSRLNKGVIINKSGQEFKVIIIPSVAVLSKAALNRLKAFQKGGGQVIFSGKKPELIIAENFLTAKGGENFSWAGNTTLPSSSDVVLNQPSTALKYLHRRWKDADLYFFFNEGEEPLSRNISLKEKGMVEEWNAETGEIKTIRSGNQLPLQFKAYESKFIIVHQ